MIRALKRKIAFALLGKGAGALGEAWMRADDSSAGGSLRYETAHLQSTWIYSCISVLAENVANIPFRFSSGERKGEDIIDQGPVVDLFNRPHPYLTRFEFWELVVSWLMLRGRCFVVGINGAGEVVNWRQLGVRSQPVTLLILNPDRLMKQCVDGILVGWRYSPSPQTDPLHAQFLLPEEVIYMRIPLPGDFYEGASPLWVATLAAQTDYASAQFMRGLMQNNADQGLIVTTDQRLSEEQRSQIDAGLRGRKRQAGRADRPLILEGGLKVEKPAVTTADMQFLENRKFIRQEICAIYRVPQEILGFTEDANRSVSDAARLNFTENRVMPLAERIEVGMEPVVRSFGVELYGWFDVDALPIMQTARRSRFDGAIKAFSIGVPIDDCNEIFDLGLRGDLPHAGKSYLPYAIQEVGTEQQLQDDTAPPTPAEPPEQDPSKATAKLLQALGKIEAKPSAPKPEAHECVQSADAYAQSINGSIRLKKSKLNKFFFEQRNRVLSALEAEMKKIAPPAPPAPPPTFNITVPAQMQAAPRRKQRITFIRDEAGKVTDADFAEV